MENLEIELANFIGSENYFKHSIGNFNYTDGIKFLADQAQCYWLLDVVGSCQHLKKVKHVPFQRWELMVNEDKSAVATMKEDSDMPVIIKQEIPFTDFPLSHIKLYLTDDVLLLPTEY
jgi:hypothetical protein